MIIYAHTHTYYEVASYSYLLWRCLNQWLFFLIVWSEVDSENMGFQS